MKNQVVKIYYFTGTGHSLKIAKDIGSHLGQYELIPIAKLIKQKQSIVIEGDVIGFIFPVYFARPPVVVQNFIERASFKKISYAFAITDGGGLFGRTLKIFDKLITEKSCKLNAGFTVGMPGNHPKIASMQRKKPEFLYEQATIRINEISKLIKNKESFKIETNFGLLGGFFSYIAFKKPFAASLLKELDSEFYVNENCINCGTCEKICPADNIFDSVNSPKFKNQCYNCLACYHHCPQWAIQIKGLGTEKLKRYFNPKISIDELIILNS